MNGIEQKKDQIEYRQCGIEKGGKRQRGGEEVVSEGTGENVDRRQQNAENAINGLQ